MISQLLQEQLISLQELLKSIKEDDYQYRSAMLGNNSIGQHVRHVAEMIQCLLNGYDQSIVDYDARKRDVRIETDRLFTLSVLQSFIGEIHRPDKGLTLQQSLCSESIHTTYYRELHYNMEHAIHHMALIRVALREMNLDAVSGNFGVAYATIQYKKEQECAQ
jgi:uncharacterized damage-inducible protein DinB